MARKCGLKRCGVVRGACAGVLLASGCGIVPPPNGGDDTALRFTFDFRDGLQGWTAEVADYPLQQEPILQFESGLRKYPAELGLDGTGFYVKSNNSSDDLFTFVKRRLNASDGIVPGSTYRVHYDILVASNAPVGCVGVGGSAGESVFLKAGASAIEPLTVPSGDGSLIVPNVDIGIQGEGGAAASVAGTVGNGLACDLISNLESAPYALILRSHTHETDVTASDEGELWLFVGTDSGFESVTALYYQQSMIELSRADGGA